MMTKAELQKKVDELRELKAMKEELENEVKETERQIISYMTEHEVTEEITDTANFRNFIKRICRKYEDYEKF